MPDNTYATKADLDAMEHRMMQQFEQIRQQFERVDQRFEQMHNYIDERTRDMQTELLRGFARYQEGASIRLAKLSADV